MKWLLVHQNPPSSFIAIDLPISTDTCAAPIIAGLKALSIGLIVGSSESPAPAQNVNDITAETNPIAEALIYESNIILGPITVSFPEPLPSPIIATTHLSILFLRIIILNTKKNAHGRKRIDVKVKSPCATKRIPG